MDLNARYVYFLNGTDYIGIDLQYLLHEARQSYFSAIAGLHRWDNLDLISPGSLPMLPDII